MQPQLTPEAFHKQWAGTQLNERQSYQMHFADLCRMVGCETPSGSGVDANGKAYAFEYGLKKAGGTQGFADVFYDGHFAVEYKGAGRYKDLKAAYQQLLQYREKLNNPPLLVVTDIEKWEIHTNFPNTEKKVYRFTHDEITRTQVQRWLHHLFYAPDQLHPRRNTAQVTADAAQVFQIIADNMRDWEADPDRIAHFLTKLVFCLFAEDVTLLPAGPRGDTGIFSEIVERTRTKPESFKHYAHELFEAMAVGGEVMFSQIPYFNGSLFDDVNVEDLSLEALTALEKASNLDWSAIEPAIFGTLFERSLDPNKRAQLGAHYTSRDDILLIVEPVLMQPLRREWERIQGEAQPIRAKYDAAQNKRTQTENANKLIKLRDAMLKQIREITVLDPACGSGNFLYVSLQLLMDLEKAVIKSDLFAGLTEPFPEVHPRQMYGIEINPIAHALASIVVWIGYIQWRQNNGYMGYKEPILEELAGNIVCKDAILAFDDDGEPIEPEWQAADVIVSNPPFLGSRKLRGELGDTYVTRVESVYRNTFHNSTPDLVCYWFAKATNHLKHTHVRRVGMIATNSIRGGTNRIVLDRIVKDSQIFDAWSDNEWILNGAAVRVSIICFDGGIENSILLDGIPVAKINADLTADVDITDANILKENTDLSFQGVVKRGQFDLDEELAQQMIKNDPKNIEVLKPIRNGLDITRGSRKKWIVDFGVDTPIEVAKTFLEPFRYVEQHVLPLRLNANQESARRLWWLHWNPRPILKQKLKSLKRYIATPTVAKHRLFVWFETGIHPDHQLIVFAREDDYFFGVLHSRLHEVWSLRMGTSLEDRPRYTPTTTFETFPFPWSPGSEDAGHPAYQAISAAARQLHEERDAWLNPVGVTGAALKERTLTNLYNALNVLRGKESIKIKAAAGDFAPRLDALHQALDQAVCDAYGWDASILDDEEAILRRLLALNLERGK